MLQSTQIETCPPGCGGHIFPDDNKVHFSVEQVLAATAYAGEHRRMHVSRELDERLGAPVVRLTDAIDAPMTPAEALQLAAALAVEALTAQATWQVTR